MLKQQREFRKSLCMWCHAHCAVLLEVEDGRVVGVGPDDEHPLSRITARQTRACRRIRALSEWLNHPDRLSFPRKRMGEKGESKWQTMSWDQALDEIAEKLGQIKDKYGPEAFAVTTGTGRTHTEYMRRFIHLLGTSNSIGQGAICSGPSTMVDNLLFGAQTWAPMRGSKCILAWGGGIPMYYPHVWLNALEAKRQGAKLIVIDPREIESVRRADIWLQPRPGTDCALGMAMINVIIEEGLYDKEFVENWCHGFDKLAKRAKEYPPERVAEITWVPAEKIGAAARMYATNKPAAIQHGMGLEQLPNAIHALQARHILPAITGNLDMRAGQGMLVTADKRWVEHADIDFSDTLPTKAQREKQIGADRFKLMAWPAYEAIKPHVERVHGKMHSGTQWINYAHAPSVYRAILTGQPYPVRAMLTMCSNPMITQANTKLVYKALKALDLYFVHDFWMTPSAELADYVLPAAAWPERPLSQHGFIFMWEAAIPARCEGKYDRRTDFDLCQGLGVRLGQEEHWPWKTLEEAYDYRLAPMGFSLKEWAAQMKGRPPRLEKQYLQEGFATPTGKVELYSTILEELGYDPLPHYEEPPESPISNPELAQEYPLILITGGRFNPMYHSEHRQIESLRKQHPEPITQINPHTAAKLGIEDGDWVWIETLRGRVRQKCQLFEGIDPRVVHSEHGWWFPELPGEEPWLHGVWESNINVVTDDDPEHCEKIAGIWPLRTALCRVYKAKVY